MFLVKINLERAIQLYRPFSRGGWKQFYFSPENGNVVIETRLGVLIIAFDTRKIPNCLIV